VEFSINSIGFKSVVLPAPERAQFNIVSPIKQVLQGLGAKSRGLQETLGGTNSLWPGLHRMKRTGGFRFGFLGAGKKDFNNSTFRQVCPEHTEGRACARADQV
jgi:hypothetical protein